MDGTMPYLPAASCPWVLTAACLQPSSISLTASRASAQDSGQGEPIAACSQEEHGGWDARAANVSTSAPWQAGSALTCSAVAQALEETGEEATFRQAGCTCPAAWRRRCGRRCSHERGERVGTDLTTELRARPARHRQGDQPQQHRVRGHRVATGVLAHKHAPSWPITDFVKVERPVEPPRTRRTSLRPRGSAHTAARPAVHPMLPVLIHNFSGVPSCCSDFCRL